ncbi:dihydroxyacetone kinase subunit DhaL [Clostridium sp.]|jgi:phosphoenolpyruvate---glycerone phosphotransferase subunit DhaL|uniref:dihydroxyacetone kinase subunit DhaL n=1 Tax=Clostridium sp. TaxID=1506 RepID=UPI003A5C32BE
MKANQVKELLIKVCDMYVDNQEELNKYDTVIGDGDHGSTMARGAKAAKLKLEELEDGSCTDYFKMYGRTLISTLGGAIGPLFGTIFLELGRACKNKEEFDIEQLSEGIKNAETKICALGGAKVGDKTMIDAISPTAKALEEVVSENMDLKEGVKKALEAAECGVKSTIPLRANKGRSKYLQDKAIGHQDAGATSFYYFIKVIDDYVNDNLD